MKIYLEEQIKLHPSMQMQDVVKLCYQAAYGAEHLLRDIEVARRFFEAEWSKTIPENIPLYENISDTYCRVNIAAWKYQERPAEELFELFARTAEKKTYDDEALLDMLEQAAGILATLQTNFTVADFREYSRKYLSEGICAVHHSDEYREKEKPAYRLVKRELITE